MKGGGGGGGGAEDDDGETVMARANRKCIYYDTSRVLFKW